MGDGARRATRYGALPIIALAATQMLEQGERLSLAQALDGMKIEFGASDTALGGIAVVMTVFGVFGAIPFGRLADRVRRTRLLAGAMGIWTLCMGLSALAPGLRPLMWARAGVGLVEANGPAAVSLVADYYPVQDRGRAMSRYQAGSAIGGGIGLGLGGLLIGVYGFRAAFWMWIPLGIGVTLLLLRVPEPVRGERDAAMADDLHSVEVGHIGAHLDLPAPTRVGTFDYSGGSAWDCVREVLRIRSMWFAALSLTISQFFLAALGYWGIEYFKRDFGLSEQAAGGYAVLLGAGAFAGLVTGGTVADRLLRRGVLQARVLVPAISSLLATVTLLPALLGTNLVIVGVFFFLSGVLVTLPVAPAEALMADVVPGPLRGRAASARSIVRSLASTSPFVVGVISDALGENLGLALALLSPLFAIGGAVMFLAAKTYPADLAFVAAEAKRVGAPSLTRVSHSEA